MKSKMILKIESYSHKEGMLILSVKDFGLRAVLKNLVDFCHEKKGDWIRCEFSPPYQQRTLSMNNRWWAMCTDYGNYCGMTKDEVAEGVKWQACDEGLWELVDVPFSKSGRKEPKSTSESDTEEMGVLIEVLKRIASEDGFIFED